MRGREQRRSWGRAIMDFLSAASSGPEAHRRLSREAVRVVLPDSKAQRRSWLLAEAAFGSDADEAAYRRALEAGDTAEIERLDAEAQERVERARRWLEENE